MRAHFHVQFGDKIDIMLDMIIVIQKIGPVDTAESLRAVRVHATKRDAYDIQTR